MPGPNTSQYVLGRNSVFQLKVLNINAATGGTPTPGPYVNICVSSGSIDLTANTISIINNCNYGWEIKLPGTKSGTLSLTGHVVGPNGGVIGLNDIDVMKIHGQLISFSCVAYDSNNVAGIAFEAIGAVVGSRVSIDINEAVQVELSIEISGQPLAGSFIAMADSN